eukprot:COSAG04_NODE_6337_length_1353_cov_2.255183_1_plen_249_part_10
MKNESCWLGGFLFLHGTHSKSWINIYTMLKDRGTLGDDAVIGVTEDRAHALAMLATLSLDGGSVLHMCKMMRGDFWASGLLQIAIELSGEDFREDFKRGDDAVGRADGSCGLGADVCNCTTLFTNGAYNVRINILGERYIDDQGRALSKKTTLASGLTLAEACNVIMYGLEPPRLMLDGETHSAAMDRIKGGEGSQSMKTKRLQVWQRKAYKETHGVDVKGSAEPRRPSRRDFQKQVGVMAMRYILMIR